MRPDERVVAGLSCSAVMAALSDYIDGEAPDALRRQVEAHVADCDWCQRFGDGFGRLLQAFRRDLAAPPPLTPGEQARLTAALAAGTRDAPDRQG